MKSVVCCCDRLGSRLYEANYCLYVDQSWLPYLAQHSFQFVGNKGFFGKTRKKIPGC